MQRTSNNSGREIHDDHREGAEDRSNPDQVPTRSGFGLSGCRTRDLASSGNAHHVGYDLKSFNILPAL